MRPLPPLACLIALALASCREPTATPTAGQALYEQYCAVCHGVDGRTLPDLPSTPHLNSQGLLTVADDAFLTASIARGRPGDNGREKPGTKMSIYGEDLGGPLTNEQIADIVGYIRSWQTDPSVELPPYQAGGDPIAGKKQFEVCVPCHGQDGWSASGPSLAGQTLQESASDAFLRHTILNGRPGTTMPAFKLSDRDVDDLVAFVRTLYFPAPTPAP
jgi:mono/diheme cytochrome c family protein